MNGFSDWLRRVGQKIGMGVRHFMQGRYGPDKLGNAILYTSIAIMILSLLIQLPLLNWILTVVYYALWVWAIMRMLSRNTYKRYQENRKYLMLLERIKDKEHKYFDCPRCRQPVRVPRKKGKISITCPKCKEKFIRKT